MYKTHFTLQLLYIFIKSMIKSTLTVLYRIKLTETGSFRGALMILTLFTFKMYIHDLTVHYPQVNVNPNMKKACFFIILNQNRIHFELALPLKL